MSLSRLRAPVEAAPPVPAGGVTAGDRARRTAGGGAVGAARDAVMLIGLVLVALMTDPALAGPAPAPAGSVSFSDLPVTHPYAEAISRLVERNVIEGFADGSFGPDAGVTRQQLAKMLVLALALPVTEADICPFTDVAPGGPDTLYPDNYVAVAASRGLARGTAPSLFAPRAGITRAQLFSMVERALEAIAPERVVIPPAGWTSAWDPAFSPEHGLNARRAEASGLLAGLPLKRLDPWQPIPRGEVAQVLWNLVGLVGPPVRPLAAESGQRLAGLFQVGPHETAAARYDVVILNEWNAGRIPRLKVANPRIKVLLYKNTFFLRADDNASTVGGFASGEHIDRTHPDWFLLDSRGRRIAYPYYPDIEAYAMDWGNEQWRAYWSARAIDRAQALGFDGLFLDDLYTSPFGVLDRPLQRYPDTPSLQAAVRGFLAYVYGEVKATDPELLVVGNVVDHLWYPDLWADWLTVSDGLMDEHFVHDGTSTTTGYKSAEDWWKLQLDELVAAEAAGKLGIFVSEGATHDADTMLFAYATYLLAANGSSRYYHELGGSLDTPSWFDLWAVDLGPPNGGYSIDATGVYQREFAGGLVLVNPFKSATKTVAVTGCTDLAGHPVTRVTLGPHRAAILLKP